MTTLSPARVRALDEGTQVMLRSVYRVRELVPRGNQGRG